MTALFAFLGIFILYIFNICGFYFAKLILQASLRLWHHLLFFVLSGVNTFALMFTGKSTNSVPIACSLLFILLLAEFILVFKKDFIAIFSAATTFVFHLLSARAVSAALFAIFFNVGIYEVQQCDFLRVVSLFVTLVFLVIIFMAYYRKWPGESLMALYQNRSQLVLLCAIEGVLLLYQILCAASYSLATNEIWFVVFHISSALLSMLWHYNLADNTIKYSVWINQSFKTDILTEQLNRQLNHYDAYEKQFEGFRQFKSDYDKLIGNVRYSIANGDIDNAQTLLQLAGENVQKLESRHIKYCNNMLVDSILWDAACAAQAKDINFSAEVSLPDWVSFSELEYCRIFENICTNALEAAGKAKKPSYIIFKSSVSGPWLTIVQENSFATAPKISKGHFVSSKKDPELHGVGIKSVREILESHSGFVEIEVDKEKKNFKLVMHICRPK